MTPAFVRGFKAEAERLASEVRGELRLEQSSAFDPQVLANHLAIPVISLADLALASASSVTHFLTKAREEFSAMTVFRGSSRLIVFNPSHSRGRRANSLSHELSHVLLDHEAGPAIDKLGCRQWSANQEQEADWLGGVLLVPREVALSVLRAGLSIELAADKYGVSVKLMRWRLHHSGAAAQFKRGQERSRRLK